jgi:hypothetical protein
MKIKIVIRFEENLEHEDIKRINSNSFNNRAYGLYFR